MSSYEEKVVLITGCSQGGIGFALCEAFASHGCKVYATSRKLDTMSGFTDPLILTLAMDVTSDEQVQATVAEILMKEGRIDVLVNNAGGLGIDPLLDLRMSKVQAVFETNTFGSLRLVQAVVPSMAERKRGLIINVGSVVGDSPTPWNGLYSASKAALHTLSEVLGMELRPFHVKVMLIKPVAIISNISKNAQGSGYHLPTDSLYTRFLGNIRMRINASQQGGMPAADFARRVVSAALQKHPPASMTLGGNSLLFRVLRLLPRSWMLWIMWRAHSKPVPVTET